MERSVSVSLAINPNAKVPAIVDGDTVVFLGDSITHQCLYTQYVEDYFYTRFPGKRIHFHNAGVGGDRAANALARFELLRREGVHVGATHLLIQAAAKALAANPQLHQIVAGSKRLRPESVDIGLSVAGETFVAPVNSETAVRRYGNAGVLSVSVKSSLNRPTITSVSCPGDQLRW